MKTSTTTELSFENQIYLAKTIPAKFDELETKRQSQLADLRLIREAIYQPQIPTTNAWNVQIELPEIYELAQTLKSHISENIYSNPESMFDVSGTTQKAQNLANKQKAMLVHTFEQMKFKEELERIIDSVIETGECTLFVGWETKYQQVRRAQTFEEQLISPSEDGFVIEENILYDNAKIRYIKPEDFVFDKENDFNKTAKIYKTKSTIDELIHNKSNNLINVEKIAKLRGLTNKEDKKIEILEYWGDIELKDGEILKNILVVVAGRCEIIRFEKNPFVTNPFIHANIIESPITGRGISPLRVALIMNNISSTILNKQLDALSLMMNPPYLAPKGCFKGEQIVKPGKIIEYEAALMPNAPTALSFDKALHGWEFLNYFKNTMESATGIFKNMSGNIQSEARTATELNYSVSGQTARLNMILESINRKIIIPTVEKTAQIIATFKMGKEVISLNHSGKLCFIEIDDDVRNSNYIYRYGDRKASLERKVRSKELFDVVKSFAEVEEVAQRINWIECFKFALEQYGIENANNYLKDSENIS